MGKLKNRPCNDNKSSICNVSSYRFNKSKKISMKNILEISINTMSELGLNMIYFKLFVLHLQSLQRKKYRLAQAQENSIAFEVENLELMLEKLKK